MDVKDPSEMLVNSCQITQVMLTAPKATAMLNQLRTTVKSFRCNMYILSSQETKYSNAAISKEELRNFCWELYRYMAK